MKRKNIYELTFEMYYTHNLEAGHFFNFLIRYYDQNSKIHVNSTTATEGNLYSISVAKILNILNNNKIVNNRIGLVYFKLDQVEYLEKMFWLAKNCKISNSCITSKNRVGKIYYQYFDSLADMRTDFWNKLVYMKTYIQTEKKYINYIADLY